MDNINFNDFEKLGISLTIGENTYYIKGIPYPIEKDIYKRIPEYNEIFKNLFNITDEQLQRMKDWIIGILNYKKNGNNVTEEIFEEIGLTELITCFVVIINFVTKRISAMQGISGMQEKKTAESITENPK
jgi:hypothetical protein